MEDFLKIIPVFLTSLLGFAKVSVPTAVSLFGFNFWKVLLVTCSGSFIGILIFTYISSAFLKWWERFKLTYFKNHQRPKVFTKTNRVIIKIKKRFGLWGIALFIPIGLSIPLGTFIAERYYKNKKKIIIVLSVSVILWNICIYFILLFFYSSVKSVL